VDLAADYRRRLRVVFLPGSTQLRRDPISPQPGRLRYRVKRDGASPNWSAGHGLRLRAHAIPSHETTARRSPDPVAENESDQTLENVENQGLLGDRWEQKSVAVSTAERRSSSTRLDRPH
jgi:hypothetical protein